MADKSGMPGSVRPRHNVVVDPTRRADPPFNKNNVLSDRDMTMNLDYMKSYEKMGGIPNMNLTNKKKSSFQITSVTAVKHSEVHEGDADSMDDLDETHTEDISSEVLDWSSRTTDIEPDQSSPAEETLGNLGLVVEAAINKERTDTTSRFKVVKIASKEPFRRGRWWCSDFSDDSTADRERERAVSDLRNEEFSVPVSENSSAASSVHYVPDQQNEHEEMKDPVNMFSLKMDGVSGVILDEDADYDLQQRQATVMKVMPDSGQANMTDMFQQKGIPQNAGLLPNTSNLNSVSQQAVKEFTNTPPLIPNVPKPQQSHVAQGNTLSSDQLNSASSNAPSSSQPPQSSHLKPSQTSGGGIPQSGAIGNNASELNSVKKIQDSSQGTQGMNSSQMGTGAPPGQSPGNGHANAGVASSKPDYHHQKSQQETSSNILIGQQTMTTSTVTNSQQINSAKATSDYNASNSQNLPRIQVTAQAGYKNESGAIAEESAAANDSNVTKEATKDDHLDTIESREKTQLLLEQMVSQRAGIPAALGSPIKDGEGDERHRRSPLHLMEFGSSTVAIDNKIEQAMDLVKSHLMFAVREEVEVLREQIKELLEQKAQLEYENQVLKSAASSETLQKLANGPPPQPPTTSAS